MDRIKCDHFSAENGLMVIIPHEDDEINLAGALIFDACRKKSRLGACSLPMGMLNIRLSLEFMKQSKL